MNQNPICTNLDPGSKKVRVRNHGTTRISYLTLVLMKLKEQITEHFKKKLAFLTQVSDGEGSTPPPLAETSLNYTIFLSATLVYP